MASGAIPASAIASPMARCTLTFRSRLHHMVRVIADPVANHLTQNSGIACERVIK